MSTWRRDPRTGNVALVDSRDADAAENLGWTVVADSDHWDACNATAHDYPKTPDDQIYCTFVEGHRKVPIADPYDRDDDINPEEIAEHGNPWRGCWWGTSSGPAETEPPVADPALIEYRSVIVRESDEETVWTMPEYWSTTNPDRAREMAKLTMASMYPDGHKVVLQRRPITPWETM